MKEEFVTYAQGVKLKELGFDWECTRYQVESENGAIVSETGYHNRIPERVALPTLALAQKWLRDVKYIYLNPYPERYIEDNGDGTYIYVCTGKWLCEVWDAHESEEDLSKYNAKSYEEALSLGITEALKYYV